MKTFILSVLFLFALNITAQVTPTCFSNPVINYPVAPNASRGVAAGDLNNDGIPDVVTTNMNVSNISIAYMMPGGFLGSGSNIPLTSLTPRAATIADFNGDLYNDIIVAGTSGIGFVISDGTGGFNTNTMNVGNPYGIASGDLNGDSFQDIVTANNTSGDVAVRLGNGNGSFSANTNYNTSNGCIFVALGYMNNDDTLDIVTCNSGTETISVLIGVGDGTFNSGMMFPLGATSIDPYSLTIGDVNNDGNNDVMVATNQGGNFVVFIGSSTGNLSMTNTYFAGGAPFGITSGYYNEDNFLDVAVTGLNSHNVTIFSGNGDGTFNTDAVYTTSNSLALAATADFNGDGFSDIAVANYGNNGSGAPGGFYLLLNHRAKITPLTSLDFCPGESATLAANYGQGFTYNWAPLGDTNDTITVSGSNTFTLTLANTNATCSTSVSQAIIQHPTPSVTASANPNPICQGGQTVFTGSGAQTYSWTGGVTNGTPFTPTGAGTYTVTGTDNNGCIDTGTVAINFAIPPPQEVCTVSVDSATGNFNVIVWEKPADIGNLDSFYIYRETALNIYTKIGATHRDSLSQYNDFAANPNSSAYRYKIATLDTCGNISSLGFYHNSIHLQYLGLGNFQWNHYLIEGTGQVALAYNFYRDDTGSGTLNLLQSVSGNQTTFTDVNYASFPNARYRVDVDWNITCTPTRGAVNTTRSNIKTPTSINGINEINHSVLVTVYPNPAKDKVNFKIDNNYSNKTIEIYSKLGQLIFTEEYSNPEIELNVSEFNSGMYFYKITSKEFAKTGIVTKY